MRPVDTANATDDLGVDAAPLEAFAEAIRRRDERIEEREPAGRYDRTSL